MKMKFLETQVHGQWSSLSCKPTHLKDYFSQFFVVFGNVLIQVRIRFSV